MESPTPLEKEECDRWSLPSLEAGSDNEREEIRVLRREFCHSSISVASSPAPSEPMSGLKDHPTLVEESPAPMSGVKDRPCLIVGSPEEATWGRAETTSPVPMSCTKGQPSQVDDSPTVQMVNNLSSGGDNPVEGG